MKDKPCEISRKELDEVESICKASCEHMDHMSREPCPCGYCRIRGIIYEHRRKK